MQHKPNAAPVSIVVLDDGDTWSGTATVYTLTAEAYERISSGAPVSSLTEADIIATTPAEPAPLPAEQERPR